MINYFCKIPNCVLSKVVTTDRRAIFRHYLTHLQSEIEDLALDFGLSIVNENRYSLINAIIERSQVKLQ